MTGDELSLREMTSSNEEKPRVMKLGKRNIKAQVRFPCRLVFTTFTLWLSGPFFKYRIKNERTIMLDSSVRLHTTEVRLYLSWRSDKLVDVDYRDLLKIFGTI